MCVWLTKCRTLFHLGSFPRSLPPLRPLLTPAAPSLSPAAPQPSTFLYRHTPCSSPEEAAMTSHHIPPQVALLLHWTLHLRGSRQLKSFWESTKNWLCLGYRFNVSIKFVCLCSRLVLFVIFSVKVKNINWFCYAVVSSGALFKYYFKTICFKITSTC